MEDLFKAAGIDPTKDQLRGEKPSASSQPAETPDDDTFGGHNLRKSIPLKSLGEGTNVIPRPRSRLNSASAQANLINLVAGDTTNIKAPPRLAPSSKRTHTEDYDEYDDEEYDEDDEIEEGEYESDEDEATITTPRRKGARLHESPSPASTTRAPVVLPPHTAQPIPLTMVKPHSALGQAAALAYSRPGFELSRELGWQAAVGGDNAKVKLFRQEVTQQVDVTAFGFMRPTSPYVQIIHSIATYAVRGGTSDLHNMDFGFIGDRTDFRIPTPIALDDKMWKWEKKTMGLDVPPLEAFYAKASNAELLYHDDASGGEKISVPRMLYLPPPFLVYCLEKQRTPFELHRFITAYATRDGSEVNIKECEPMMDWLWAHIVHYCIPCLGPDACSIDSVMRCGRR